MHQDTILKQSHEIYLKIKAFYTVSFHFQGRYQIRAKVYDTQNEDCYGLPILPRKKQQEQELCDEFSFQSFDYEIPAFQTKKFNIDYNCDLITLNENVGFKFEIPHCKQLIIKFEIFKIPDIQQPHIHSSQQLLKQQLSNREIKKQIGNGWPAKKKSKNPEAATPINIGQYCLTVNLNTSENLSQSCKSIIFPKYQYFGVLYIAISHVMSGYLIRNKRIGLTQFCQQIKSQKQKNNREMVIQSQQTLPQIDHQQKKTIIVQNIKTIATNPLQIYQILIAKQLKTLKKLSHFAKSIKNLYSYVEEPYQDPGLKRPTIDTIRENYQASSNEQLYYQIYMQSKVISQQILSKWVEYLDLISHPEFDRKLFNKLAIRNFTSEIDSLKKQKSVKQLKRAHAKDRLRFMDFFINLKQKNRLPSLSYQYNFLDITNYRPKYQGQYYNLMPRLEIIQRKNTDLILANNDRLMNQVDQQQTLFVFVHGFYGSEHDFFKIKANISSMLAGNILLIRSIEDQFHLSINQLGYLTAQEIKEYLKKSQKNLMKINFIGFSLGGVIIRASLKYLSDLSKRLNVLITLSTPHLGVSDNSSCLVKTYTNLINLCLKNTILKQLDLKDRQNESRGSYLQQLSQDDFINHFKLVVLVGSEHDHYVPLYSSALAVEKQVTKDDRIIQMHQNLFQRLQNVHLINVNFNKDRKFSLMSKILLRTVHTSFLQDQSFLYLLFSSYYLDM